MRIARILVGLVLVAGLANAQTVQRIQPLPAQVMVPPVATTTNAGTASLPKDYEALYQKELEKNRQLRAEVATLTSRIAEITRPGGSLVQAYCESSSVSRNTAGARNDCAGSGFACEPVSGLCRTSARSSDECAAGFTYCSLHANCVRTAGECQ